MSAFHDNFTDPNHNGPVNGVRGTYSVNYASGVVPEHVDLADLTPADLEADARQYGHVLVRIGNLPIEAVYRKAVGDVIYRNVANSSVILPADLPMHLANAVALAQ